ncbi:MAG: hypothetical protein WBB01_18945 [Phormidesmis sp.]
MVETIRRTVQTVKSARQQIRNASEDVVRSISQRGRRTHITNQKEFRIVGLRRSGNHAIINWILSQEIGNICWLNDLRMQKNPFYWKYHALLGYHPQYQEKTDRLKKDLRGEFTPKDCLAYSYEDYDLTEVVSNRFISRHDLYFGKSKEQYDILILRDPFNLMASRLKSGKVSVKSKGKTATDLWVAYAKEFSGETQFLENTKVCISYNHWFSDPAYRQVIAQKLKLNFSDAGMNEVATQGGGSSFDGQHLNGKAAAMDVLNRWKQFADDPAFQAALSEEARFYSKQIFGDFQGAVMKP